MSYLQLAYVHLATVVPALLVGAFLLTREKGDPGHRHAGKVYLTLMFATGVVTLFMPAKVGPQVFGHFGWLHGLSLLVLCTVPAGYLAARNHSVGKHRRSMILLYTGAVAAGLFALAPGRLLHRWLFGM